MNGEGQPDQGGGVKVSSDEPSAPPLPPFKDFFVAEADLRMVGDLPHESNARRKPSGRGVPCKSPELAGAVQRLAAEGLTRLEIARQLGVGVSTLYANFFPELSGRRGCPGRRRFEPSDAGRARVMDMRAAGATQMEIAQALGISVPTLRLVYSDELGSRSTTAQCRADRDAGRIAGGGGGQ